MLLSRRRGVDEHPQEISRRLCRRLAIGNPPYTSTLEGIMVHRHSLIEDVAGPPPRARLHRDLFQVLQDPALQVVHLWKALLQHERRSLLEANTTGTEHRHLAMLLGVEVLAHIRRKVRERSKRRRERSRKRSNLGLVGIARIEHKHFRIGD